MNEILAMIGNNLSVPEFVIVIYFLWAMDKKFIAFFAGIRERLVKIETLLGISNGGTNE